MRAMIAVFLNNKLISADTVVPLMLDVRRSMPDRAIEFYCADAKTIGVLRMNVVLWEAMAAVGTFHDVSSPSRSLAGRVRGICRKLGAVVRLGCKALVGRVHFIHFRALNEWPFLALALVNPRRTVLMESTCWGYHKRMIEEVGNQNGQRQWSAKPGRGATLVAFSPDWPELADPAHAGKPKLVVPSTHFSPAWSDFLAAEGKRYVDDMLTAAGWQPGTPLLVYFLGYLGGFDFLRSRESMLELLEDTLDALEEYSQRMPVVLKPHAITDRAVLAQAIARRPRGRFIVADVHPMVLARFAVAVVANHFSLTFADAHAVGTPTIEHTQYSDATLALTKQASMRAEFVTHFVNSDPTRFRAVLAEMVDTPVARETMTRHGEPMAPVLAALAS